MIFTVNQKVPISKLIQKDFTPANGLYIHILSANMNGPFRGDFQGRLIWDPEGESETLIDFWSGDKAARYNQRDSTFEFKADGIKVLRVELENANTELECFAGCSVMYQVGKENPQ